jgi:hypothetical protein
MHQATIFRISGRVDFLDMPILDRIEENETKWALSEIDEIESNQKSIRTIMSDYFMQQTPVKLKNYADFTKLRVDFNTDYDIQKRLTDRNNV